MALMPWHEQNEPSTADLSLSNINPTFSNAETSIIEDGGDAKQLAHVHTFCSKSSEYEYDELNKRDDLAHLGEGFPLQNPRAHSLENSNGEIINSTFSEKSLEECLRAAMITSKGRDSGQRSFVPVDDLDRIINAKTLSELKRLKIVPNENLRYCTDQICERHEGKSPQDGKITLTSRRRFFATLVLINQTSAILEVIKAGLYDWDLPLALDGSRPGYPQLTLKGIGYKPNPVAFSQEWHSFQREAFFHCQWQSLSPYIEMRAQQDAKINHYPLDSNTILPITEMSGPDHCGGFGSVSKIRIHPAHRNSLENDSGSWLALKRLYYSNEQAFRAEVDPHKRLGKDHPHLIQLLATYQYGEDYYLLFPWADGGNLYDFFQSHPRADFPARDPKLAKWLASQLLGLADALFSIHNWELDPAAANMSSFNSDELRKKYGAHGDLKPENILWFGKKDSNNESFSLGTFQISDFGLTSFHGLESRQKFKPSGMSATYRAPEFDLTGRVSQQYDMWSLGCVLAELVTWYLLGGDAVTQFRSERLEDTTPGMKEDNFFSMPDHPDYHPVGRATEKKSVLEHFNMLRNLPDCTDFLLDLIDFVDRKLLRMSPEKRCQIPELLQFAKLIRQKCHEENSSYCLERTNPVRSRQGTDLSELCSPSISHPNSRRMNSSNSEREIPEPRSDARATYQNIMQQDPQDLKSRRSMVGSAKLSSGMRPRDIRIRSVSTVGEVETPIESQYDEEHDDQKGASPPPTPTPGNANNNEVHSGGSHLLNFPTSISVPKAIHLTTDGQTDTVPTGNSQVSLRETPKLSSGDVSRSPFYQGSNRAILCLDDEGVKRKAYGVSEQCLSFERIWAKIRKWSVFLRE
ncbi:kinase-like domain-containing protein [Nemania diffusa]|nr:kinase-like domain-containing protein [Nemania diffusa]